MNKLTNAEISQKCIDIFGAPVLPLKIENEMFDVTLNPYNSYRNSNNFVVLSIVPAGGNKYHDFLPYWQSSRISIAGLLKKLDTFIVNGIICIKKELKEKRRQQGELLQKYKSRMDTKKKIWDCFSGDLETFGGDYAFEYPKDSVTGNVRIEHVLDMVNDKYCPDDNYKNVVQVPSTMDHCLRSSSSNSNYPLNFNFRCKPETDSVAMDGRIKLTENNCERVKEIIKELIEISSEKI